MKTKCLRIGKRTLSVVLSVLMLVSTVIVGNVGTLEASAETYSTVTVAGPGVKNLDGSNSDDSGITLQSVSTDNLTVSNRTVGELYSGDIYITANQEFYLFLNGDKKGTNVSGGYTIPDYENRATITTYYSANRRLYFAKEGLCRVYFTHLYDGTSDKGWYVLFKKLYANTVNINNEDGGQATLTESYALSGEEVTLTVMPTEGYDYTVLKNSTNITSDVVNGGGKYTYSATKDVVFSVSFSNSEIATHTITVNDHDGTDTIPTAEVAEGSTVNFTVTPPEGKVVDTITATDGATITGTTNDETRVYSGSFTMPSSDVTVTITYKAAPKSTRTVYYRNINNWSTVCAYTFSDEKLGEWPGTAMTLVEGETNLYTIEVPTGTNSIIFNNNNNGQQTGDITGITDGKEYSPLDGASCRLMGHLNNTTSWVSDYSNCLPFQLDAEGKLYCDITITSGQTRFFRVMKRIGGTTTQYGPSTDQQDIANNSSDSNSKLNKGETNNSVKYTGAGKTYRIFVDPVILVSDNSANIWINDRYSVTINTPENGKAQINRTTAVVGDKITITATPNQHYVIDTVTAKVGTGAATAVSMTYNGSSLVDGVGSYTGTYTVPSAGNVTITVTFKEYKLTGLTAKAQYTNDNLNWNDLGKPDSEENKLNAANVEITQTTAQPTRENGLPTVTASTTDSSYSFVEWYSANGTFGDKKSSSTTFTPTADNAVAVARFARNYNLTFETSDGGTLSAVSGGTSFPVGSEVKIKVVPETGKFLETLTVTAGSEDPTEINVEDKLSYDEDGDYYYYTIEMPGAATTVTGTFTDDRQYTVKASTTNGKVKIENVTKSASSEDASSAELTVTKGDKVKLTYTPASGTSYVSFSHWNIDTKKYDEYSTADLTQESVTITPKSDLNVTAEFKLDTSIAGSVSNNRHILLSADKDSAESFAANTATVYESKDSTDNRYYAFLDASNLSSLYDADPIYFALSSSGVIGNLYTSTTAVFADEQDRKELFNVIIDSKYSEYLSTYDTCYETSTDENYYYLKFKILSEDVRAIVVRVGRHNESSSSNTPSHRGYEFELIPILEDASSSANANITVYAKNATVRNDGKTDVSKHNKYSKISDTKILDFYTKEEIGESYSVDNTTAYTQKAAVAKGDTVFIQTTIKSAYRDQYYLKAFSVNGESYNIIEESERSSDGVYTLELKIPENSTVTTYEITPIYFHIENGNSLNYITFYVEDYNVAAKADWGNTLACYAWYSGSGDTEALGAYPGQPLVYDSLRQRHYIQIPKSYNNGAISGITLNNYIWDDIHSEITLNTLDSYYRSGNNYQTYDYDDFVNLANNVDNVDTITFRFEYYDVPEAQKNQGTNPYQSGTNLNQKLNDKAQVNYPDYVDGNTGYRYDYYMLVDAGRETNTNYGNTPSGRNNLQTSYYVNEAVALTNQSNERVDFFHHVLRSEDLDNDKYTVVSDGYMNVYFGSFATLWSVYDSSGNYKGTLPPSAFFFELETQDPETKAWSIKTQYNNSIYFNGANLRTNVIPNEFMKGATDKLYDERASYWKVYATLYNEAKGHPVEIHFESNIYAAYPMNTIHEQTDQVTVKNASNNTVYLGGGSIPLLKHGVDSNSPGYRCDGLWFYTKSTDLIRATISIKYKNLNADGTLSANWATDDQDKTSTKYKGTTTAATAYFTDDGIGSYQDSETNNRIYLKYSNTNDTHYVTRDTASDFVFKADRYGKGSTATINGESKATKFVFDGWYLANGDKVNSSDTYSLTGEKVKLLDYTLEARYVEVVNDELAVEHKLLKNDVDTTKTITTDNPNAQIEHIVDKNDNLIIPHAEDGDTYVSKLEIVDGDNKVVKTLVDKETKTNTEKLSLIDVYQYSEEKYKLRITLTTAYAKDAAVKLEGFYNIESDVYYRGSEKAPLLDTSSEENPDGENDTIVTTNVYKVKVSELLNDEKTVFTTHNVKLRSDISRTIDITLNYYDRNMEHGVAADVNSTATPFILPYAVTYKNTVKAMADDVKVTLSEGISNVLDEHVFWFTQENAIEGIKGMKYYSEAKDKTPNTTTGDTYAEILTAQNKAEEQINEILQYHTNQYGVPMDSNKQKWVTYKGVESDLTDNSPLDGVTDVTIWTYNYPRKYQFTANYTAEATETTYVDKKDPETDEVVQEAITTTVVPKITTESYNDGALYIDKTSHFTKLYGFYNQRIGQVDKLANKEYNVNEVVPYLRRRGITSPYFTTGLDGYDEGTTTSISNENGFMVTAAAKAISGNVNLVFDGWYVKDYNGYHKVSSDRSYQNRVVGDIKVVAGYRPEDTEASNIKVTITQNENDYYIDEDYTKKVRFNTQLNISGAKEKDENIRDVAVLYMKLPTTDSDGNTIVWDETTKAQLNWYVQNDITLQKKVSTHLTLLDNARKANGYGFGKYSVTNTKVTVNVWDIQFDDNGKIVCYAYEVVNSSDDIDGDTAKISLTNKNRLQFTWDMSLDYYRNNPFLAFAAVMYYEEPEEKDDNWTYNSDGNLSGANWIISDNFVSNMVDTVNVAEKPVVANTNSSGGSEKTFLMTMVEHEPTVNPSSASFEESDIVDDEIIESAEIESVQDEQSDEIEETEEREILESESESFESETVETDSIER